MDEQTLVNLAYRENLAMNSNWCKTIQILNSTFNLHSKQLGAKDFPNMMKKKITSDFIKHWKSRISNPAVEKKLSLYSSIKHNFGIEPYMNLPFRGRQIISKIVGSSHTLHIETGRHHGIPREERICKFCDLNKVEDEEHFVSECPAYSSIRQEFFGHEHPKAKEMLLQMQPTTIAAFLRRSYSKRDELLADRAPEFHSVKTSTMRTTIIKGPKKVSWSTM